jgi:mRNA interferase RelE/StbE
MAYEHRTPLLFSYASGDSRQPAWKQAIISLDKSRSLAILSLLKTIILTLNAAKDLDVLPREAREQVEAGLHRYAMTGQGNVKALQGRDGYRLRIGSYRVIFDEDAITILAIYIGRRATTTYKRS